MPKQNIGWPNKLHNDMKEQSGANLTSMTMSSHICELKNSGIEDCNAMNNPPGSELETREWESPSISDVELEENVWPPVKGKEKAVPDDTAQGQNMTHPLILGQCIICKGKMKALIAQDYTQDIDIWQQGQMTKISWMSSCWR